MNNQHDVILGQIRQLLNAADEPLTDEQEDILERAALGINLPKPMLEAFALVQKKDQDYNSAVKRAHYFPLGLASYAQMLHVKSLRMINLSERSAKSQQTNFESARDTCLDLINYACFCAEAMDNGEIK